MFTLDPELEKYATKVQWRHLQAWEKHGSQRLAAEATGVSKSLMHVSLKAALKKAAKNGYAPDHDMTHAAAPGFNVKGTSTMYDADGEMKLQWVKTSVDQQRQEEMFQAALEAFGSELPREVAVLKPETKQSENLMACYPVGDHHMGMLSWDDETGDNYDMSIAEQLLMGATNHLVGVAPDSQQCTIVFLGDFMHYDSFVAETPTSRNALDADSRFPRMVRFAIRNMRYLIHRCLLKHEQVNVIVEIGNHDLSSSIFLMECLKNVYENEPRVHIDNSPAHFHYFQFGLCLVGVHHGHGAKLQDLPLIMAADRPEEWGSTQFRYWWTGHVHHKETQVSRGKELKGTVVESFRTLAPKDAWAAQKGYRDGQDMQCIVLHKDYGETCRHTMNPRMLK